MRIYLGITGTGGKILGSFEVENVWERRGKGALGKVSEYFAMVNGYTQAGFVVEFLRGIGYTNQRYAIELRDYRDEDYEVISPDEVCKRCTVMRRFCQEDCVIDEDEFDIQFFCKDEAVKKLPQSFCYIVDPHTGEKAILMPIQQKHFDMIASGEAKYLFKNTLPKALREV